MDGKRYAFQRSDLVGGHPVLDLVNTVTGRSSRSFDWLEDYERVLEWAALTDAFDRTSLRTLDRMSADGRAATRALRRLRDLREAVYPILLSAVRGETPPERALAQLEKHWKSSVASARLASAGGQAILELDVERSRLDYPRHVLALGAVDLMRTLPLQRTRECASCSWIFIDTSRGGQRRWCSMATCGNIEKSRRHYERRRAPR